MDQIKIGKFIRQKGKEKNITQSELAEKLNITDRAISKWENGNCMPDVGIITELCKILNITINDLFSGEKVDMKKNEKILENNLLEMAKLKEEKDKQLLTLEWVLMFIVISAFLTILFVASYIEMANWLKALLIVISLLILLFGVVFGIRIEQTAGYYKCRNCEHKYIPTFNSVLWAMHFGRTRFMKCPKCKKYSWNKKILTK